MQDRQQLLLTVEYHVDNWLVLVYTFEEAE